MQNLREIVGREIYSLESLLLEIQTNQPSFGPQKLLRALLFIVNKHIEFFKKVSSFNFEEREAQERIYTYLLKKMTWLHNTFLKYFTAQQQYLTPSEILLSLIRVAKSFKTESFVFSLWASSPYNYTVELFSDLVTKQLRDLDLLCRSTIGDVIDIRPEEEFPKWFVEISFPNIQSRNGLIQCLLFHELAHIIDIDKKISEKLSGLCDINHELANEIIRKMNDDQRLRTQIYDELHRVPRALRTDPIPTPLGIIVDDMITRMYHCWLYIIKSWLGECIADLFAAKILGPAYVLAFTEFNQITDVGNKYSPSHPNYNFRISLLIKELSKLNYKPENQPEIYSHLPEPNLRRDGLPKEPENQFYMIPYEAVISIIDNIFNEVEKEDNIKGYTRDIYQLEIPEIVKILLESIPPTERWVGDKNTSINPIAILNAGWFLYLNNLESYYQSVGANECKKKAEALNNLNNLLLKAIEGSEILNIWREI